MYKYIDYRYIHSWAIWNRIGVHILLKYFLWKGLPLFLITRMKYDNEELFTWKHLKEWFLTLLNRSQLMSSHREKEKKKKRIERKKRKMLNLKEEKTLKSCEVFWDSFGKNVRYIQITYTTACRFIGVNNVYFFICFCL